LRRFWDDMERRAAIFRRQLDEGYTGMYGAVGGMGREEATGVALREADIAQWVLDLTAGHKTIEMLAATGVSRGTARLIAADAGLSEADTSRLMSLIPAAQGFSGLVSQPTMFLAGEAGPEHVRVTPMSQPGFTGAAGGSVHFTINVSAWDAADMDRYVRDKLGPHLMKYIQGVGRRGGTVTDDVGIRRVKAA